MELISFILLTVFFYLNCISAQRNETLFPGENWGSGIIDLGDGGDDMFYVLIKSRKIQKDNRLVIWLNGGPGCSSMGGLFWSHGPYKINRKEKALKYNNYSWNNIANVLYVDQPVGTGFSKAKPNGECTNEECVANNFMVFLIKFISQNPEFMQAPLYLTGVCYAGKYIPAIGNHILKANHPYINLKGVLIAPSYTDQIEQEIGSSDYFYERGIFNLVSFFAGKIATILFVIPYYLKWNTKADELLIRYEEYFYPKVINIYDLKDNESYDILYNITEEILNKNSIKKLLRVPLDRKFISCSDIVEEKLYYDSHNSQRPNMEYLLNRNMTVYILQGLDDGDVNPNLGKKLINSLQWYGKKDYEKAEEKEWKINDIKYATGKKAHNFQTLMVENAGHYLAYSQPLFMQYVLETLINSTL